MNWKEVFLESEIYSDNPLFEKATIKGNKLILTGTLMGQKTKIKPFIKGSFMIIKEEPLY